MAFEHLHLLFVCQCLVFSAGIDKAIIGIEKKLVLDVVVSMLAVKYCGLVVSGHLETVCVSLKNACKKSESE